VHDDDMDAEEEVAMTDSSPQGGDDAGAASAAFSCFGMDCSALPCCRSHNGKYMDRRKRMDGRPDITIKQYPVRGTQTNLSNKNPMNVNIR
jgi:hypothetical protein